MRQTPLDLEVTFKLLFTQPPCLELEQTEPGKVGCLPMFTRLWVPGKDSHLSLSTPSPVLSLVREAVWGHIACNLKADVWLLYGLFSHC